MCLQKSSLQGVVKKAIRLRQMGALAASGRCLAPVGPCGRRAHRGLRDKLRGRVDDRRAPHVAHVIRCLEGRGAVHGAAIVPDHQIADLPLVAVDELRLRCEFDQLAKQRLSLLDRYADDVRCVRGNIQRVPRRTRMPPYQLVSRWGV